MDYRPRGFVLSYFKISEMVNNFSILHQMTRIYYRRQALYKTNNECFFHSCNRTNIFIRWTMKCSLRIGYENMCSLALINIISIIQPMPCIWHTYIFVYCAAQSRLLILAKSYMHEFHQWFNGSTLLSTNINKNTLQRCMQA